MSWLVWKVLIPIIILGILILIHELGHFLLAKKCGVGVISFSIGFGPALFSRKIGNTTYKIAAIPLGGYVQMVGEDPSFALDPAVPAVPDGSDSGEDPATEAEIIRTVVPEEFLNNKDTWFINKTLLQRTLIVAAGPVFNLVSAYIFVLIMLVGYGDEFPNPLSVLGKIDANSPADLAGLKAGDTIRKMDSVPITKWEEFSKRIRGGEGKQTVVTVARKGPDSVTEELDFTVTPEKKNYAGQDLYLIGVKPEISKRAYGFTESLTKSALWIWEFSYQTIKGLGGMIIGQVSPKELAGPLAILDAAGDHAERGFADTLYFMSIVSISLAILNLLPIPVLDGGHLLFFLIEALLGPVSLRKREIANQVGLAFLLLFMGVALTNDVRREAAEKEKPNGGIEWNKDAPKTDVAPKETPPGK